MADQESILEALSVEDAVDIQTHTKTFERAGFTFAVTHTKGHGIMISINLAEAAIKVEVQAAISQLEKVLQTGE